MNTLSATIIKSLECMWIYNLGAQMQENRLKHRLKQDVALNAEGLKLFKR